MKRRTNFQKSQALIEFALVSPVLLLLLFVMTLPRFRPSYILHAQSTGITGIHVVGQPVLVFDHVVDKMARLVIDRAKNGQVANSWPRWEEMLGIGPASGYVGAPRQS